jgi:hypothetical protein
MKHRCYLVVRLAGIPATRQWQPDNLLPEVEFLEEIQTEVLRVFLLAIHRHLY